MDQNIDIAGVAQLANIKENVQSMQNSTQNISLMAFDAKDETKKKVPQVIAPSDCSTYKFSWMDLILPPFETFSYLCKSFDKTYMFMAAFVRVVIWFGMAKLYMDKIKMDSRGRIGFNVIFYVGVVNLIVLLFVILKSQKFDKR